MTTFPPCSGPFAVSCADIITKYGPDRLLLRLYYPTETEMKPTDRNKALWLSDPEYATGYCNFLKFGLFSSVFRWLLSATRINAAWNLEFKLSERLKKLPVYIFSHGLGGNRTTYSAICAEFASKGNLVAAVEHSDKSACATYYLNQSESNGNPTVNKEWIQYEHVASGPDEHKIRNKQVYHRADECIATLDHITEINNGETNFAHCNIDLLKFKGAIDLEKCVIMGHSFGAATSITVLSKDKRFKVGVGLDAWMFPLDKEIYRNVTPVPILFINSEGFHWPSNVADMRKLDADALNVEVERTMVTLAGTVHQTQSDFPLLVSNKILAKFFKLSGSANPQVAYEINKDLVHSFVGKHLGTDETLPSFDDVMKANEGMVYYGSNVTVDEEKIRESKQSLSSGL